MFLRLDNPFKKTKTFKVCGMDMTVLNGPDYTDPLYGIK